MATKVDIGDRIGPYLLIGGLGAGGAGTVFRGKNEETGEEAAVKLLLPEHMENEEVSRRFVREIGVAQRVQHAHVVRYIDCAIDKGILYFAMELVPYGSLREVLRGANKLAWKDAAESAMHIAEALEAIHAEGIVHRDLKPENIYLSDDGRLKVGDFGLARDDNASKLTVSGQTVGSLRYMAPEQVRGEEHLDGRVDLYALGCLLFEMLAGRLPFDGLNTMDIFKMHVSAPIPDVRDYAYDCPYSLGQLVSRLLAKSRDDRPPSASAVRWALSAIVKSDGKEVDIDKIFAEVAASGDAVAPPTVEEKLTVEGDTEQPAANLAERLVTSSQPIEREAKPTVAIVIGIALAVVAAIAFAVSRQNSESSAEPDSAESVLQSEQDSSQ
ncbi:serine/threonine protein kinase [Calycomorphotria hydatis]|uniref:Serine/threonine-protein kinase StkP n=1 Tax=Calycomorphotria hydatis TaxID=2528027 RepID=A0A517T6C9_9PLAN|nr:serine/threonine-protein kinase [Calycomorphotria hydatis]QDT63911.1 Serine/threonine-protein kinase StkP [Calycomorphotria hydatis]